MQEWTDHSLCEKFVLAVVLVSCFSLAAKDPSKPMNTGTNYTLEMIDLAALVVFTVEMLAKVSRLPPTHHFFEFHILNVSGGLVGRQTSLYCAGHALKL